MLRVRGGDNGSLQADAREAGAVPIMLPEAGKAAASPGADVVTGLRPGLSGTSVDAEPGQSARQAPILLEIREDHIAPEF